MERLYRDIQPPRETAPLPEKPGRRALAADFAEIRRELASTRSPDALKRLRRRCALAVHPNRVDPLDRSTAEKFMAEVNAAIDRAIKDRG